MKKTIVDFEEINGKQVFYILSEPDIPQNKIVIMSHGFRGTSIGPARTFVDFAKLLVQNGFSILRFDQPNSGNSEGDYIDSSFNEWVNTTTFLASKFINKRYKVALLGQSMGATTTVIATNKENLKGKIPCIILWVPDPKSTFDNPADIVYEEGGQKYKGTFWQEAKDADFFKCLDQYQGAIDLIYGEKDKYISRELRDEVAKAVREKNGNVTILKGQDHSSWDHDFSKPVYEKELEFLKQNLW